MSQKQTPKKPSRTTVAVALMYAAIGIEILQTLYYQVRTPINLLETYSNGFVLGSVFGSVFLGAFIALLAHLYPKPISKTKLWYIGLVIPLGTLISMLRTGLDLSTTPLSTVLSAVGFVLLLSTLYPFSQTTPRDRN